MRARLRTIRTFVGLLGPVEQHVGRLDLVAFVLVRMEHATQSPVRVGDLSFAGLEMCESERQHRLTKVSELI